MFWLLFSNSWTEIGILKNLKMKNFIKQLS